MTKERKIYVGKNKYEVEKFVVVWYGEKSRTKMLGNLYDMLEGARSKERKMVSWCLLPCDSIWLQHSILCSSAMEVHTQEECISHRQFFSGPPVLALWFPASSQHSKCTRRSYISLGPGLFFSLEQGTMKLSKDWHPLAFCVPQHTSWTHCYGTSCPPKSNTQPLTTTTKANLQAFILLIAIVQDHSCCFTGTTYQTYLLV